MAPRNLSGAECCQSSLGFARRSAAYKRPNPLMHDPARWLRNSSGEEVAIAAAISAACVSSARSALVVEEADDRT